MKKIIPPLKLNAKGAAVADLHIALKNVLHKKKSVSGKPVTVAKPTAAFKKEQAAKIFGRATQNQVKKFQKENNLQVTGVVDHLTANALNDLVSHMPKETSIETLDIRDLNMEVLTLRAQGEQVSQAQGRLLELGAEIAPEELVEQLYGLTTRNAVIAFQKQNQLQVTGAVDADTNDAIQKKLSSHPRTFQVVGRIRHPNGKPGTGLVVHAFDRDLRNEQSLNQAQVDDNGYYQIRYAAAQFARAEKGSADLLVRVFDGQTTLYDPPFDAIVFNAPSLAVINIDLTEGDTQWVSEYNNILTTIRPLLDNVALDALQEDDKQRDISFVAGETGIADHKLTHFAVAQKLSTAHNIRADFFYALLAEHTLIKVGLSGAVGTRFVVTLNTDLQALFYDVVLLPEQTIGNAVKEAIQDRLVSASLQNDVDKIQKLLAAQSSQAQAYVKDEKPRILFGQLEQFLAAGKHEEVLALLQQDTFTGLPELVQKLQQAAVFKDSTSATAASTTAVMADLLGYNNQIIDSVRKTQKIARAQDVQNLARLSLADWKTTLGKSAATLKLGNQPINKELIDVHASAMVQIMEKRFPTTAFVANVERDKAVFPEHRQLLLDLTSAHPDFNLATSNIQLLLKDKTVDPIAKAKLKATQRVFKIAPTFRQTKGLLDAGIYSAAAIHAMGQTQFVNTFTQSGLFTQEEAITAFSKASDIHIASGILAGDLHTTTLAMKIPAVGGGASSSPLEEVTKDFPNMKSLFQLGDYCQCEDCRSVYSASAYVVDTLQFLKNRQVVDTTITPPTPGNAKTILFNRRPDLGDTDLSCANTNTPMPYIDKVCELLEEAIAPDPGISFQGALKSGPVPTALLTVLQSHKLAFTSAAIVYDADLNGNRIVRDVKAVCKLSPDGGPDKWRIRHLPQTYGTAAEVAAAPEYVNQNAYDTLSTSKAAFSLPFDLAHQETRRYFARFDVDRAELMRALQTATDPQDRDIAAEALGISDEVRQLISNPDASNQNQYWNTGTTPAANVMKAVDTFITKAEIGYVDLQTLIQQAWINPASKMFIRNLDTSCNLDKKEIENLDNDALDRLHRFIRLWKRISWSIATLDRVIRAKRLGNQNLDDACLICIEQLQQLLTRLDLPIEELCNLYDTLPSDGDESRYAQVFLNLAANGTVNEDFRPENVRKNEQAEANSQGSGKKLADYKDYLALCLGSKVEDIGRLIDSLGATAILSEDNIGAVYALTLLTRTLDIAAPDLLTLQSLAAIDVLQSPAKTLEFLDKLAKLSTAGMTASDLQYFLLYKAEDLNDRIMPDAAITALLATLQKGYQTAYAANLSPFSGTASVDENKSTLKTLLAKLPDFTQASLSKFMTIVDGAWSDSALTPAQFIDQSLSNYVDTVAIKTAQTAIASSTPPKDADRNAFIKVVSDTVSAYLFQQAKEALAITTLASTFKLDEGMMTVVLQSAHVKQPASVGNWTLIDLLTDDVLIDKTGTPPVSPVLSPTAFDKQYRAVRLLHMMTQFLAPMQLKPDQVQWLLQRSHTLGWLELDAVKYQADVADASFETWEQLQGALTMVAAYPPVNNPADAAHPFTVFGLFEQVITSGASVTDVLTYLAQLAGWDPTVLSALDSRFGFSTVDLTLYRAPGTYDKLEPAVRLLRTLGLDLKAGVSVIKPKLLPADSALMRQALKARYQESEWLGVLKNVQDPLREQKRDALVAYLLVQNPDMKSTDDLYDYFLIDVEMGSCMPTSRIAQAHATIQLFAERCLMGLEPRSVANVKLDTAWNQWSKWMGSFPFWVPNKKIFMWPEDWMDPRLRDNKSQLFTDMENTLQQNELTDDTVEQAVTTYLEKLDDIAQMDVMAAYYQTDITTMHVFARTKGGDPTVYYYRQFQQERYWTPWEKVDLDITGDHLLVFERNSRLSLAWPIFTEETQTDQSLQIPDQTQFKSGPIPTKKPKKRWKIQLAVSERAGDKWLPKKVSKDGLYSPPDQSYSNAPLPESNTFNFFVWKVGAAIQAITCSAHLNDTGVTFSYDTGWVGSFALTGCKGYPEPLPGGGLTNEFRPQFKNTHLLSERFVEKNPDPSDALAIWTMFNTSSDYVTLVNKTPGIFKITYPLQMSLIDIILFMWEMYQIMLAPPTAAGDPGVLPFGTFMPYFYGDVARTYVLIPGFYEKTAKDPNHPTEKTFADIYQDVEKSLTLLEQYVQEYQQDPTHDLAKYIQKFSADSRVITLQKELQAYQSLEAGMKWKNFYHPLICYLRTTLNREGIPGLMQHDVQMKDTGFVFENTYNPNTSVVLKTYPQEEINFDLGDAYSDYNWELFCHIWHEMGTSYNEAKQYDKTRECLHYMFNPLGVTDDPAPQKYWNTKPFYEMKDYSKELISKIMSDIAADPSGALISDLKYAVEQWRSNPFDPYVIARSRPVAYQLAIVLLYIKNLCDEGDDLLRQFTPESVTQATQRYILADKLLGPKPRIVPPVITPPVETYNQLEAKVGLLGNALLDLENLIPDLHLVPNTGAEPQAGPVSLSALYFCIPPNEKLLEYWDLVADRLFKIRHCQNIDGVESILPLFSPPIDPGALVRAAAAGLDLSSFVQGLGAPLPHYRFSVMSQKATDLAQQVGALGNALLQAMEKRDGEELARLRAGQEVSVLNAVRLVKLATLNEANATVEGLRKSRQVTEERKTYYSNLSKSFMNTWETTALALSGTSLAGEAAIALGYALSGGLKLIPDFMVGGAGFGGSPTGTVTTGGSKAGSAAESAVQTLSSINAALDKAAAMATTQASYHRRMDEWKFQVRLADKELAQIDQQITTATLHVDMLTKDLAAHDVQIKNAKQIDSFMHNKYTNQELYDWMIGQISSIYFKSYQLAFDTAKKAERCFQHELGSDATFLNYGYWNSLKKGLLAAEGLLHDIKRMEVAYLDDNKREYELTKHLSLLQLDPVALVQLKSTGKCIVQVPETVFDLDHPGHYMRRHKSVSLSIPCVAGPYTSVSCNLSLINNRYRKNTALHNGNGNGSGSGSGNEQVKQYEEQAGSDERFVYNVGSIQSIATSHGQSDSGMFELNFRDERYLPFEGTGAIATWLVELPTTYRQFDYQTISDVILDIRYTARDGGSAFRTRVEEIQKEMLNKMALEASRTGLYQGYNLNQQFSDAWWRLKNTNRTTLNIGKENLPYFAQGHDPVIDHVIWFARVDGNPAPSSYEIKVDTNPVTLNRNQDMGNLYIGNSANINLGTDFTLSTNDASPLQDLTMLVHYSLKS